MKPSVEQIGNLLALKREERPEEGYWRDFLCEFHQNQREQAVKRRGVSGMFGGISQWFADQGPAKWAYGAGIAYAAFTVGFLMTPSQVQVERAAPAPVRYELPPAPAPEVEQLDQLDLSPSTQGAVGEQVF